MSLTKWESFVCFRPNVFFSLSFADKPSGFVINRQNMNMVIKVLLSLKYRHICSKLYTHSTALKSLKAVMALFILTFCQYQMLITVLKCRVGWKSIPEPHCKRKFNFFLFPKTYLKRHHCFNNNKKLLYFTLYKITLRKCQLLAQYLPWFVCVILLDILWHFRLF